MKITVEMRYKLTGQHWSAFLIYGPERRTPSVVDIMECWGDAEPSVESALKLDDIMDVINTTQLGNKITRMLTPEEADLRLRRWRHKTGTLKNLDRMRKATIT
jgi:hypothetical protein